MPPTDRLLEARKTYAEIAEASRSLSERTAALERTVAATTERVAVMGRVVAALEADLEQQRDRVQHTAAQLAAETNRVRRALRRPGLWRLVWLIGGGFMGALWFHQAADLAQWLREAVWSR